MKNPTLYLERMEKSYQEKLFFLEQIDITKYDYIVDFGCANGNILRRIKYFIGDENKAQLVGYDINEDFLEIAREVTPINSNIVYINSFEDLPPKDGVNKSLIIFNSVLHEIEDINSREKIFNLMSLFDAVVIRDMIAPLTSNLPIDAITRSRIQKRSNPKMFDDFENVWGRIDNKVKMYHYFLKYTYIENWETEIKENYFSTPWGQIYNKIVFEGSHKIVFDRTYTLAYKKAMVERDFNHSMNDITHRQIIYIREAKL